MDPRHYLPMMCNLLEEPTQDLVTANAQRRMAADVIRKLRDEVVALKDEVDKCRNVLPQHIARIMYEGEG